MEIVFDYRFDTDGFFDDPGRRAALEAAGDIWGNLLQDDFPTVPAGIEFSITNPTTQQEETVVLSEEIDDLLIFVGSDSLHEPTIAEAGPDGFDARGDVFSRRISNDYRNTGPVTNFEPWAGRITFDSNVDWDFSLENPDESLTDFITIALHEIAHILGIGTSAIFEELGAGGSFEGVNALQVNGGEPIPLTEDLSHVEDGFGDRVLLDPIYNGGRNLPTELDLALLADIGYEIDGFVTQGSTPPIATDGDEEIWGTILGDVIAALEGNDLVRGFEGNDTIQGNEGDDSLFGAEGDDLLLGGANNDQLQGGMGADTLEGGEGDDTLLGEEGSDRFIFDFHSGNDLIQDFVVGEDVIEIPTNFNILREGLVSNSELFPVFTDISFGTDNEIRIFHDVELAADSIVVVNNNPPDLAVVGFEVTEDLIGREGNTTVELIVTNQGEGAAGSFTVDIVYSDDNIFDANDEVVATVEYDLGLEAGASEERSREVFLDLDTLLSRAESEDQGGEGLDYQAQHLDYLGAVVDAGNLVVESNEENNQSAFDDITLFPWDINQSGEVTPTDVVFILNRLGNAVTEENKFADFNNNGLIESNDAFAVIDRLGYEVNNQAIEIELF